MAVEDINPRLKVPRFAASRVFIELARAITADATLRQQVKRWVVPGRLDDWARGFLAAGEEVTADLCPLVALWPAPGPSGPHTNVTQAGPLDVRVRIYLATVDPLDVMDFWGRVAAAVYPQTIVEGRALAERLAEAGGSYGTIALTQPAVSVDGAGGISTGEGFVSTNFRIRGA